MTNFKVSNILNRIEMRLILTFLISSLLTTSTIAQEDAKAKSILDRLSKATKAYKTVKAEFLFSMVNKSEGINESQTGKIELKGDSYFLSIQGQDVISDGKYIYTIIKDAEEVHINDVPTDEEEDYISPNKIFTLYESGFKHKYVKEENGQHIINLYPKEADEKEFHRIALYINAAKNQVSKIKVFGKDGTLSTYTIKSFSHDITISDTRFTFNKSQYSGYEIIELFE